MQVTIYHDRISVEDPDGPVHGARICCKDMQYFFNTSVFRHIVSVADETGLKCYGWHVVDTGIGLDLPPEHMDVMQAWLDQEVGKGLYTEERAEAYMNRYRAITMLQRLSGRQYE